MTVAPLRVAIASLDHPTHACAQLRLLAPLASLGAAVQVEWLVHPETRALPADASWLARTDLVVVQRFFPNASTSAFLDQVFASRLPVVYETDDLLTALPRHNPHAEAGRRCAPEIERLIRRAAAVTVSTPALAESYAHLRERIDVLPNWIDAELFQPGPLRSGGPVSIGYIGTPTHQRDLDLIEPALRRLSEVFGDRLRFVFFGCTTPSLARLPGAEWIPLETSYLAYARALPRLAIDIALAPLEDLPFNACKSPIKWLEYAACGIPAVLSNLRPYAEHVVHGETGWLVDPDPNAWYETLRELIGSPARRVEVAARAREVVRERHALAPRAAQQLALYQRLCQPRAQVSTQATVASIVIPVFDGLALTRACLEALLEHTASPRVEIVVVDDASSDGTATYLRSLGGRIRVLTQSANCGFARACNRGARSSAGEFIVFLNNDTLPVRGWLEPLLAEVAMHKDVGIVGSKLLYPDGRVQHAGVAFARPDGLPYHLYRGVPRDHPGTRRRRELRAVTGASMLVRRSVFESVGGFDVGYRNGFEDIDLCLSARAQGAKVVLRPDSEFVHLEEQSPGRKAHDEPNMRRFFERWRGRLVPDETRLLLEDGFCSYAPPPGEPGRWIGPLRSDAERAAWQRVAELERRLEAQGVTGLTEAHATGPWPDDPEARDWAERVLRQAGIAPPAATARAEEPSAARGAPAPAEPPALQEVWRARALESLLGML